MATVDIVAASGAGKAGKVELSPAIFEAPIKPHLFHAEVRRQLAGRRAGTHSSKNRAAVSGGGAKPYRQKGTGRARQGTTRAPQYAGGGAVFGPVPRRHDHKLTKKARRAGLLSALSLRFKEGSVAVVDALELEEFKTRAIAAVLAALGLADESVLIVIAEANEKIEVSARNLPRVGCIRVEGLNVYDILRYSKLVFTEAAVVALEARLQRRARSAENALEETP